MFCDQKNLTLAPRAARDTQELFHLLPSEEEQESGNAVPVLLRMAYEESEFMSSEYFKLQDYAKLDVLDPKLNELRFDRFAKQIMRAGGMSRADWLRSDNPYTILLPDIQSQRQLVGQGMRAWVKQRLAKGDMDAALHGIKAQLGCARHCASTPIGMCHFVGLAIANLAFENLEIAMQYESCPNLYWSLAALSPTLADLGPMVRWEIWASAARLNEPLPAVGDERWTQLAKKFAAAFEIEVANARYTEQELRDLQERLQKVAEKSLRSQLGFQDTDIARMSPDEQLLRWQHLQYCQFRIQVEPLAYQSPSTVLEASRQVEQTFKAEWNACGAKAIPLPIELPHVILTCRNFQRRVKLLQTIEAIRDYASQHAGKLPKDHKDLRLPAPNDPFTNRPFEYKLEGDSARLSQVKLEGCNTMIYDHQLQIKTNATNP